MFPIYKEYSAIPNVLSRNELEYNSNLFLSRHLTQTFEFDDFLVSLLHYFECFFDQLEHEQKPHKTSFLEPSK